MGMGSLRDEILKRPEDPLDVEPPKPSGKAKSDRQRPSLKHYAVARAYADPNSPTFGNAAASYRAAAPASADNHASLNAQQQQAWQLLNRPKGKQALAEVLAEHRVDLGRRTQLLSGIAHGESVEEHREYNAEGQLIRTVQRDTAIRDKLRAVDILNRMDGSYAEAEAQVDVQTEAFKALLRKVEGASRG